jgi:hypothetical protein
MQPVDRDLLAGMANAQHIAGDGDVHRLANEAPWDGIGVAVDLDRAVGLHLAHHLTRHRKGRPTIDRS